MRLKGILHKVMYKDRADIYRHRRTIRDTGAASSEPSLVYEGIPCKLSQYGKDILSHIEDRAAILSEDLRLCCDPGYVIRPNDVVKVIHQGQRFTLHAGQRFAYPTHQEISLRRRKEAGNGE